MGCFYCGWYSFAPCRVLCHQSYLVDNSRVLLGTSGEVLGDVMECQHDFENVKCDKCAAHQTCCICNYSEHGEPSEHDEWAFFGFSANYDMEWGYADEKS